MTNILNYIDKNYLAKHSELFGKYELENLVDLDMDDWHNVLQRDLFSPYSFENYYQLLISPSQRIDTIYVLSKLEEQYWQKIFERCLYLLIGLKVFCASDLMLLSKLTDREFERADKLKIFDYDNPLMRNLSCKSLYLLAKYPEPLLEESVKSNMYRSLEQCKKLLSEEGLVADANDNKTAFQMKNCSISEIVNQSTKLKDKVFYLHSTQPFLPQTSFKKKRIQCTKNSKCK